MEFLHIMRALEREVDAVWTAIEPLLPEIRDHHPLGCHRPRIPDRLCFRGILTRMVTDCSWTDAEALLDHQVSDTTLLARRDEWNAAGVFDRLAEEAIAAYVRIIGLDLGEVALDGSQHRAPCGGEGTGPNCTDKGRSGWKWSLATDRNGIPIGWIAAAANNNDCTLVAATLDTIAKRGLLSEFDTLHIERSYDFAFVRAECAERGTDDIQIPKCGKRKRQGCLAKKTVPPGLRWPVERTNSWLSNFGQLRRNTDRRVRDRDRDAQLALAIALLLTAKLIGWRDRWSPIR